MKIDWINIHRHRLILHFLIAIWQFTEFVRITVFNLKLIETFSSSFSSTLMSMSNKLFTTRNPIKSSRFTKNSSKRQKSKQKQRYSVCLPLQFPGKKIQTQSLTLSLWRVRKIQFLALILLFRRVFEVLGVVNCLVGCMLPRFLQGAPKSWDEDAANEGDVVRALLSDIVTLSVGRRSWVSVVEQNFLSTQFTRNCKCVWS